MSNKTINYLRAYRKRGGLTQDEVAFLLGCKSGAKVSRYEKLMRQPNLQSVVACQAIFGVQAHELFPDIYKKVEQETIKRAEELLRTMNKNDHEPLNQRK